VGIKLKISRWKPVSELKSLAPWLLFADISGTPRGKLTRALKDCGLQADSNRLFFCRSPLRNRRRNVLAPASVRGMLAAWTAKGSDMIDSLCHLLDVLCVLIPILLLLSVAGRIFNTADRRRRKKGDHDD